MSRIIVLGLTAAILAACQPAAEPAASAQTAAPTAAEQAALDAAWTALEDRYLTMETVPSDPVEALEWREVHCNFLVGELGGDPEIDRQIDARIEEIGCLRQAEDARALKATRMTDTAAVARLDTFISRHE